MVRVRGQTGVADVGDPLVRGEELGHRQRVGVLGAHAQRQRLEAPRQQERRVRVETPAVGAEHRRDLLDPPLRTGDGPRGDVGVAVERLGRRVAHQIETDAVRPEVHRSGEGVVDDRGQPVAPREARDALQVADPDERVRDALDEERLRAGAQRFRPRVRIHGVDQVECPTEAFGLLGEEAVGPAVERPGGDEMVARAQGAVQHTGDGGHPRGGGDGGLGALQGREPAVQVALRGIGAQADVPDVVHRAPQRGLEDRALVDREDHRAVRRGPRLSAVDGQGLEPGFRIVHLTDVTAAS